MVNFLILFSTLAFGAISNPDRAIVERGYNVLKNSSFESAKSGWTASGGSFTISNTAANVFEGVSSATWDSNGAAQTLTGTLASVNGLAGTNGELTCYVKVPSGTATHTMGIWDGSTLSQTQTLVNTSTNYIANTINFVYPSSGSVTVRFTSVLADEVSISIDKCYMGPATNLSQVSQAKLIDAVTVTGCAGGWSTTSTSYATFGTQTGCTYTSAKGLCTTPATNIPGVKCSSLPPGDYRLEYEGAIEQGTTAKSAYFKFYDGTNSAREDSAFYNNGTGGYNIIGISQSISYTTASSNLTLEVRGKTDASGTTKIYGTTAVPGVFKIWYFPSQTQLAVQPSQQNYDWTAYTPTISSGFGSVTNVSFLHKRDGSMLTVKGTFTTGTVSTGLGTFTLPNGLTIDTAKMTLAANTSNSGPKVGELVQSTANGTATALVASTSTSTSLIYLGGIYTSSTALVPVANATTSLGSSAVTSVTFTVPISGWIQTNANPAIVGQISSNTLGQERIERATIAGNASVATITSQSGSWLSFTSRGGTGDYVWTMSGFSAVPTCTCTSVGASGGSPRFCTIRTLTQTSLGTLQTNSAGSATDSDSATIVCMGPK